MEQPDRAALSVRLREMTPEDVAEVHEIELQSFAAPWSKTYFSQCIKAGYDCWVLEGPARIEGYTILGMSGMTAHLLNLCVRPDSRDRGLGRQMLSRMIDLCKLRARLLMLEVRPSNLVAIDLYKSMGFQGVGVRPGYYRDDEGEEDALVMVLRL
jgi:ribosomal-protein-alanine N-acetyltransferase